MCVFIYYFPNLFYFCSNLKYFIFCERLYYCLVHSYLLCFYLKLTENLHYCCFVIFECLKIYCHIFDLEIGNRPILVYFNFYQVLLAIYFLTFDKHRTDNHYFYNVLNCLIEQKIHEFDLFLIIFYHFRNFFKGNLYIMLCLT